MDETTGQPTQANHCDPPRPAMTFERRKDLVKLAEAVADDLGPKVEPHERCFFREAVELYLGDRYR